MKKQYVTFVEIGYGHEEPIRFEATPAEALKIAYEYYLEDEHNECLISDNDPEDLAAPEVYEIQKLDGDDDMFLKMCTSIKEENEKRYQANIKKDQLEREAKAAALTKLSAEEKKILGIR